MGSTPYTSKPKRRISGNHVQVEFTEAAKLERASHLLDGTAIDDNGPRADSHQWPHPHRVIASNLFSNIERFITVFVGA